MRGYEATEHGRAQLPQFPEPAAAIQVAPAPYVRIALAAAIFGLSEKAIRRKIEDGKWLEGREYRRSPDGEIWISVQGVTRWVERGQG